MRMFNFVAVFMVCYFYNMTIRTSFAYDLLVIIIPLLYITQFELFQGRYNTQLYTREF